MSRVSRKVNDEVVNGHPGFPWHQATTEDLTQAGERFILRQVKCGCYVVTYLPGTIKTEQLNRRRTRLGRLIERRWYR